jgi:phosphate-selective porin OprO and OprP
MFRQLKSLIVIMVCLFSVRAYSQGIFAQDSVKSKNQNKPEQKLDWNEWDLGFTTFRPGVAAIMDYAAYSQDGTGKAQMDSGKLDLKDQWKWRDVRVFAQGKINIKRKLVWKVGVMYDGAEDAWTFRETDIIIGLPEIFGEVMIGRQKEGYSFNKVQNGYSCWGNERQMSLDPISIMADGIRFTGYIPKPRLYYTAGAFTNAIYGHDNKFALWEWQVPLRFGWRVIYDEKKDELLQFGINVRFAEPDQDKMRVKSRPESNPAPYFLDTKTFASDACYTFGTEAYYRYKRYMIGSETNIYSYKSSQAGNPLFWGANLFASYMLTDDSWPYLNNISTFFFVKPKKSIFDGGYGAIELLFQASIYNLNDGLMPGGKFWKISPMINWYLSYNFRFELEYGYGMLDRFHLNGTTQFFQMRFQMQIL